MSEKEKMIAGNMYDANDPELVHDRYTARSLSMQAMLEPDNDKRSAMISQLVQTRGEANFGGGIKFDYGYNISVGHRFYCNHDCVFLDGAPIRFGDDCMLGPAVQVYTASHPLKASERNAGLEYSQAITVGNNVWIGGNATLCPGITLGDNVVVAAGAVVTKSFGNDVLIGGNPARILKAIEN